MRAKQIIGVVIIWIIGSYAMAGHPSYHSLRDVDFENYTYRYADQAFRVKDGRYESKGEETAMESLDVVSVKFGSLTQTAREDAVVLTRYNGGGTGVFDALHIYKLQKGQPVLVDVIEGGDRANGGIRTFYIENGSLYITSYDGELNACNACEDYERTTEYRWNGQELAVIWKSEPRQISTSAIEGEEDEEEVEGEESNEAVSNVAQADKSSESESVATRHETGERPNAKETGESLAELLNSSPGKKACDSAATPVQAAILKKETRPYLRPDRESAH